MMRRRDLITAAAGALVATVLAGGVAWAAIPAADGTIQACYGKIGGVVRFIDPAKGEKCSPALENTVTINAKGLKGDPGPQGQPGKDGLNGTNGVNGKDGINGTDGAPGAPGADGEDGLPGSNGTNGTTGTDGVSVTSASEPVGANCANAGSKFTAANGITYACNGTQGPPGTGALSGYEDVFGPSVMIPAGGTALAQAPCPSGKKALGGGFLPIGDTTRAVLRTSFAGNSATGASTWLVQVTNASGTVLEVKAFVTCAE